MKKRIVSLLLALVTVLGMFPTAAFAAATEEEALGEVDIYNGGTEMSYLSINGRIREQIYTYYNYVNANGQIREIPAYCVNPNTAGVPQTVAPGESIKYLAEEIASDPKIMGIVANGYPKRGLYELKLENKYHAYYATKMALWCYILPNWDIANLKVNPNLTGLELERAQDILRAAKEIYQRGTAWTTTLSPKLTTSVDREVAYDVTVDGRQYKQQIFTVNSETWVCDYNIAVSFTNPDEVPAGTRIVDMENKDITAITTEATGQGYSGKFKVLFPADAVAGQTGSVQLSFGADVYKYAIYYAVCAEKDKYGEIQNYMCDTDPTTPIRLSAYSSYGDEPMPEMETGLKITKYETGTTTPLSGAIFEVISPAGDSIGTFATNSSGIIAVPLTIIGNYTVIERVSSSFHLLGSNTTQNVTVTYGNVAEVTFENEPYGNLIVEKYSDTGMKLPGAIIRIKHIESGVTYTAESNFSGSAIFEQVKPGAFEIFEETAPSGWQKDDTIHTVNVAAGETTVYPLINKELPGLRITKYDRINHTCLPDVTFSLWHDGEFYGNFKTDEFGEILITNAEPGTWLAQEADTGNPAYILNSTPQQIELEAGDGIRDLLFFNDLKPGLHLTKVDSTDPSKEIAGAVFEIKAVDGSFGPEEFVTGQDGTIDLSSLPENRAYVVTEKSCNGYVIDQHQRIIHLDANENVEYVFTNTIKPTLRIVKLSSDGTPLEGVAFRISYIQDGTRYLDRVTTSEGIIEISDMEPGVLSVQETSTVSDHILDPKEYHVQLFPGKTSELVVENQIRPNLTVWKFDADDPKVPVEGATFLVEYADGHSIAEVTTGPDGSATVYNLLPSVVKITEKSVPSPFLLDSEPQLATLYPNRDRDVYFYNHKAPTVSITKEDSITGERLDNVKFRVYYASNKTSSGEYRDLGVFVTDENGEIHLSRAEHGVEDGWFRVVEVEPKTGYAIKGSDTQEVFAQSGKSVNFRFENTPLSAIVIWKYDSKNSTPLSANFQLRYLGGTSGTGGTVIGTYTTSPVTGTVTITGLKAGTYIVEEISVNSPDHVVDSAPQTVYISGEDQDVVQVRFGNAPKGSLLIAKKSDKGEPLAGVEFMVTDSTGAVIGDANGKFWSNSAGEVLISGILPGTTLIAKETKGLDGYVMDDVAQQAVIRAGQTVGLEFINAKKGNLIIQKCGIQGDKKIPLEGVEFKLTYADGRFVDAEVGKLSSNGVYFTNKEGQIVLSNVVGTIVATEVASVPGFSIDPSTQTQTVVINAGDDTQTLYFYNHAVGGLSLTKVNAADTSERIPDTVFEIRKAGDDALIDTIITDSNGTAFLALVDGNYYAQEIEANSKFILDSEKHYFEVKDGGTYHLQVKNRAKSQILIHKIDSTTEEGIYGVSFLLYDANKNPIGQYVSDQDGYVLIDDLPGSGRYYLRELENEGYILDTDLKTVFVTAGSTAEVEWENTPITGQIQITKTSADYNSMNGWPAGTPIPNTEFEIYNYRTGKLVDTVRTGKNGVAISKPLPLSRYKVVESKSAEFYGLDQTPIEAEIEHAGQIVKVSMTNKSLYTNVSIKKTSYVEVMPGQSICYNFSDIANNSTTNLTSFYWRDTLPQAVRLDKIVTGSYNVPGNYKIVYQTNLSGGAFRTLADNLSTKQNYVLDASPAALGLASNEYITQFMVSFGVVPANFRQVEAPRVYCNVVSWLTGGTQFTNQADAGGVYNGQWIMATTRWVTKVYKPAQPLPRTGY